MEEIRKHDYLYYVENKPEISDYAYDQLYKELELLEKEHPEWVTSTSPSQRVGDPLREGFQQLPHSSPMLSLANTYNAEELKSFVERVYKLTEKKQVPFYAELKMDGVAISVRYEEGKYVRALTRGDGKKGDDITANLKTLRSLPLTLQGPSIPPVLEVRGEVFMPHTVFQKLNQEKEEEGEEPWANPRNATAGSLKLLDPHEVARRRLSLVFYGIAESEKPPVDTQQEVHALLKQLGLPSFHKDHHHLCHSVEEILAFAKKIEEKRDFLPFDIDGVVIKVNDIKMHALLGTTGKAPRYAVAYKFAPEQALTRICRVTLQVGRTGVLTPVAELEPVLLAGSTIARATLHNQEEIERKDIRIGDTVIIEKGGDVIPKVVSVDLNLRPLGTHPWKMPLNCPFCGTLLVQSDEQVAVRCPNLKGCREQVIRRLAFFASKDAMDIDHLGAKVAEQLVRKELVSHLSDIYRLNVESLTKLEGFKEKSIHNLLSSIDRSRHVTLSRFILALGIRFIGEESAEILAEECRSIEKLSQLSQEDFLKIDGIGDKMAEALVLYFQDPENVQEIEALLQAGVSPEPPKQDRRTDHLFSGKSFVLTGTLPSYTRGQAEALIKERGGKISSTVSKNTDYLLVGEEAGSKLEKAKKLQIQLLDKAEFRQLL